MTITKQEATRLECVLISSILENPTARFGPHICTALAYAPEFCRKAVPACGCESNFIYHRVCPHIVAVAHYLKSHETPNPHQENVS